MGEEYRHGPDIVRIAALIGDPARASMLYALMDGRALTAAELARQAGVTAQTASSHLAQLEAGGLVGHRRQGRHKYVTLADHGIAGLLEALMGVAAKAGHLRHRPGPRDAGLRRARICYDHLAGELGIGIFDSLMAQGHLNRDKALTLSASGSEFLRGLGIDPATLPRRTPQCRECLDWSERKSHLAGSVGRALLAKFQERGWIRRVGDTRLLRVTQSGSQHLSALFPIAGRAPNFFRAG